MDENINPGRLTATSATLSGAALLVLLIERVEYDGTDVVITFHG
jgi:hypothetical protein